MAALAIARRRVFPTMRQGCRSLSSGPAAVEPPVDKAVGYWLLGCGGLVAGMVSIGGLTRLTKSGLSMTEWNLTGRKPPMNDEEWRLEFERYKTFPECQQRQSMTVDEFKYIFAWEYGHRMLGRVVGVAFGVPLAYFLARGRIPAHLKGRMAGLLGLGGAQGIIGAWMVQSGLDMDPEQKKEIRVSPYRLATHLGMAFTTYSMLLWTALDVLKPQPALARAAAALPPALARQASHVRGGAALSAGVVFATALSGAFVAGNDAGNAFNTFPDMDGQWVPEGVLELTPLWRNAFENTATVQFDHRVMALCSTGAVALTLGLARGRGPALWQALPSDTRLWVGGMGAMVAAQVSLGVSTLLLYVPLELAAAHQFGSLVLLSLSAAAAHSLKGVAFSATPVALAGAGALAAPAFAILVAAEAERTPISK